MNLMQLERKTVRTPNITYVKISIGGTPNKVYSQGMKERDMWQEFRRRFEKEKNSMNELPSIQVRDFISL